MPKFYRLSEVARMLKVSPLTVRRWVQGGKLKAIHPEGTRLYRIPETSLEQFIGEEWIEAIKPEPPAEDKGEKPKPRRR